MSIEALLTDVPPGLWLFAGALLLPFARGWARMVLAVLLPLAVFHVIWHLPSGLGQQWSWYGYDFTPVLADQLGRLIAMALILVTGAAMLFCARRAETAEIVWALFAAGAVLGLVLAGDFVVLFIFWQLLVLVTTLLIAVHRPAAAAASLRYFGLQCLASLLLLGGILTHLHAGDAIHLVPLSPDAPAGMLILAGLLINISTWPLSAWLLDSKRAVSEPGLLLLPVFMLYSAIYILLRLFPGLEWLLVIGFVLTAFALINAVLENDIRRLLLDAMLAQAGLVLVAVGMGGELALNGAAAWTFVQILTYGLLWMTAVAVIRQTGDYRLTRLGDLFRDMPVTCACAAIGAASVMAVPLTAGYITQLMPPAAAAELAFTGTWILLIAASAAAVLHAGLRYPWLVFFASNTGGYRSGEVALDARVAMLGLAIGLIVLGMAPCRLYQVLPYSRVCEPYTAGQLLPWLQMLVFAVLAFVLCRSLLAARARTPVRSDWLWRRLLAITTPAVGWLGRGLGRVALHGGRLLWSGLRRLVARAGYADDALNGPAVAALLGWLLLLLVAATGLRLFGQ